MILSHELIRKLFLMQHINVNQKQQQGFTLLEMITVAIIVGILAAISAPNFLTLLRRNEFRQTATQFEGILQKSQREAIRTSESCEVDIDPPPNKDEYPTVNSCIDNITLSNVDTVEFGDSASEVDDNFSIEYGFRGNTNFNNNPIRLCSEQGNITRELTISSPLGLISKETVEGNQCS